MYVQSGQAYPGGQTVVIQPNGAILTSSAPVGQPMLFTQQQVNVVNVCDYDLTSKTKKVGSEAFI